MEIILSVCVGVALSAACGFRVFVPLLALCIASRAGHVTLSPDFVWIAGDAALFAFGAAAALEIAAYYIPWLDNLLDTLSTPVAILAGIIVSASVITDLSPFLRWTLAVVAGGGMAGLVQATTVTTRVASTAGTGGLANPVLATAELGGSLLTSALALLWPVLAALLLAAILWFCFRNRSVLAVR